MKSWPRSSTRTSTKSLVNSNSRALRTIAFLILAWPACSGPSQNLDRSAEHEVGTVPAWVRCPPARPGSLIALGVAAPRIKPEETLAAACENARQHLARNIASAVISASYVVTWNSSDYGEFATSLETPKAVLPEVETAAATTQTWVDPASGTGYCLAEFKTEGQANNPCALTDLCGSPDVETGPRPEWVDHPPSGRGALFAVGMAPMRAYASNALEESSRAGMGGLSTLLAATVSGMADVVQSTTGVALVAEQFTSSTTLLSGVQVVAWWLDPKRGDTYTLVCLPSAGVKVEFVRAVSQALKTQDAPAAAVDPEKFHAEQLDKLKTVLESGL